MVHASVKLDGIVNNPNHAANHSPRRTRYSYCFRATLEQTSDSGQRIGKRPENPGQLKSGFLHGRLVAHE
jgi:hypothetical protein